VLTSFRGLQLSWYTGDWHSDEIMFEPPLPPRCVYDTGWACVRAQVLQEICIPMTSQEISLPGKSLQLGNLNVGEGFCVNFAGLLYNFHICTSPD